MSNKSSNPNKRVKAQHAKRAKDYHQRRRELNALAVTRYRERHPERVLVSRQKRDPERRRAVSRAYYHRHKEKCNAYTRQWLRNRKEQYRAILHEAKNKACADCNVKYPHFVMDFDHVRGDKLFNLGQVSALIPSWQDLHDEIAKCDVVCANCHRIRTNARTTLA